MLDIPTTPGNLDNPLAIEALTLVKKLKKNLAYKDTESPNNHKSPDDDSDNDSGNMRVITLNTDQSLDEPHIKSISSSPKQSKFASNTKRRTKRAKNQQNNADQLLANS